MKLTFMFTYYGVYLFWKIRFSNEKNYPYSQGG